MVNELCPDAHSLAVRLTDDEDLRRLNRNHRGIDRSTDVLSFPGARTVEGYHLGDLAVSVPTAARQAGVQGHSLEREIKILLLHGVLHLLGYDHETDDGEMEALEGKLRRRYC